MAVNDGLGATLKIGANVIGQIVDITGPSREYGTQETTNLDSVARTYRPTLPEGGSVTFTIQEDLSIASHMALIALMNSQTGTTVCVIEYDDGYTTTFDGIVTAYEPSIAVGENIEASVTIKVSGLPVTEAPETP